MAKLQATAFPLSCKLLTNPFPTAVLRVYYLGQIRHIGFIIFLAEAKAALPPVIVTIADHES